MAVGDMIFLLTRTGSLTWTVPTGVTAIKVECFGSTIGYTNYFTDIASKVNGGSYSQTSMLSVTAGSTVYLNNGTSGASVWLNKTSNTAPTTVADGCLAVSGNTNPDSQVAANVGDIKYAGGNGFATTSSSLIYGAGGQAGPNGPGADADGLYSNTGAYNENAGQDFFLGSGGGANGGISGGLGSIPYGRSGGAFGGNGGYWTGSAYVSPTQDVLGQAQYIITLSGAYPLKTPINYGPFGGGGGTTFAEGESIWGIRVDGAQSFIVITVVESTQKSIVFSGNQSGSFTIPSDFLSLVSIRSWGAAGINSGGITATNGGGGGGAGYSETIGSNIDPATMVAGSTPVYYSVPALGGGSSTSSWINIGTNAQPTSSSSGVLAFCGGNTSNNTGGTGGATASAVGSTKNAGGNGGTGFILTRNNGGGGGGAGGPSGSGAVGGNGFTTTNRGGGGGGASNGGSAGSNGATAAGGAGGSITGGTGGTGATASVAATAGTNGGGGGGGFASPTLPPKGSVLFVESGSYVINGGTGGRGGFAGLPNSGGNGGAGVYANSNGDLVYGDGLVVFTYSAVNIPPVTSNSNFLMFF